MGLLIYKHSQVGQVTLPPHLFCSQRSWLRCPQGKSISASQQHIPSALHKWLRQSFVQRNRLFAKEKFKFSFDWKMPGKLCVENCVENLHGKWGKRENRRIKISFTGTSKTKFWHEKRANVVVIYLMLQVFVERTHTHTNRQKTKQTHTQKGRQTVWKVTGKANDRRNKMKEGRMNFLARPESIRNSCAIFNRQERGEGENERGARGRQIVEPLWH